MNKNNFKFYTGVLKTIKEDNTRYIVGVASSTSIDRDNDRMSEAALQTMKSTAEANLTIFTNHEYEIPDNLFGSCVEATIKAQKDKDPISIKSVDGITKITTFQPQEMQIKIKVVSDSVNPKAGQIYQAIEEGVNLGFSIGGSVNKVMKVTDEETKKSYNLIDSIDLYEISLIGIAANADAMNVAISKALSGKNVINADKEQIEEIVKKLEAIKPKEAQYTLDGVHKYLVSMLKGYYDEVYNGSDVTGTIISPAEKAKQEAEYEEEDMQRAKAQAENVLLGAGIEVKVADSDEHTIHLRSHSFSMESLIYLGKDTALIADHLKTHLKKLQKEIDTTETIKGE